MGSQLLNEILEDVVDLEDLVAGAVPHVLSLCCHARVRRGLLPLAGPGSMAKPHACQGRRTRFLPLRFFPYAVLIFSPSPKRTCLRNPAASTRTGGSGASLGTSVSPVVCTPYAVKVRACPARLRTARLATSRRNERRPPSWPPRLTFSLRWCLLNALHSARDLHCALPLAGRR